MRIFRLVLGLWLVLAAAPAGARRDGPPPIAYWFVDSLTKVFPDDPAGTGRLETASFLAARRSHLSIQLALRASRPVDALTVEARPLTGPGKPIRSIRVRWVEYVTVNSSTRDTPDEELVRKAPGLFPDALLEEFPIPLAEDQTRSIWLTVHIPAAQKPGLYKGELRLRRGGATLARVRYAVSVQRATVPERIPLAITQYFNLGDSHLRRFFGVARFSDEWWQLIANLARFLAEYHHNVMMAGVVPLVSADVRGGELHYDFGNFERFFQIFISAGVDGYIDGGNLLRRERRRDAPITMQAWVPEGGQAALHNLPWDDPQAQQFLNSFLPALYRRLEEKGWTKKYLQGVMDEPNDSEKKPFAETAAAVRRLMPGVRMIEPVGLRQDMEFMRDIAIWVAHLGSLEGKWEVLDRHIQSGGEVWFYTALSPRGRYPNRFIDYSLLKVRLLHWINFQHRLPGFLHWGGNYWGPEPFRDTQPVINQGRTLLPPGDAYITYPNGAKKTLYSSIRLEQMREGIEDFALLEELNRKDPERARKLAAEAVPTLTGYVRQPQRFREIHQSLLKALE